MAPPAAAMTTRRELSLVSLRRRRQQLERRLLAGGERLVRSGRLHERTIFAPVEARRHAGLDRIGDMAQLDLDFGLADMQNALADRNQVLRRVSAETLS